jgi:organic radical activating enzyme
MAQEKLGHLPNYQFVSKGCGELMQLRELLFFEWVVVDNCNLDCDYCINKGEYSQKPKGKMLYVQGLEVAIARKISELSTKAQRVHVNLTGGEPLLCANLIEVLEILASAENITVSLITNLKLIGKYAADIARVIPRITINGSLHIQYREQQEIEDIVEFVSTYKNRLSISLTQVDHSLADGRSKVDYIRKKAGLSVHYQTYVPPWTDAGKVDNAHEIMAANFVSTKGKRCCLGFSHFFLLPDGTFHYDLWCEPKTQKTGSFLELGPDNFDVYILDDMKKCPKSHCGCNYNIFNFSDYIAACKRLGYPSEEAFVSNNERILPRLKRLMHKVLAI